METFLETTPTSGYGEKRANFHLPRDVYVLPLSQRKVISATSEAGTPLR